MLSSTWGACEIRDFDMARDVRDDEAQRALGELLVEHGVLCIRLAERLSDPEMQSLLTMFGPIKDPIGTARDGSPLRYGEQRQVIDSGFVMTDELRAELDGSLGGDAVRPGLFEFFLRTSQNPLMS